MKKWLIQLADHFDHYVLRHSFYGVCQRIGLSHWWDEVRYFKTIEGQASFMIENGSTIIRGVLDEKGDELLQGMLAQLDGKEVRIVIYHYIHGSSKLGMKPTATHAVRCKGTGKEND